ncbi:unnamed protein product [Amoebophrya sp. A25]|nr:unnamed protein product [Amoebophrya sp. A25]
MLKNLFASRTPSPAPSPEPLSEEDLIAMERDGLVGDEVEMFAKLEPRDGQAVGSHLDPPRLPMRLDDFYKNFVDFGHAHHLENNVNPQSQNFVQFLGKFQSEYLYRTFNGRTPRYSELVAAYGLKKVIGRNIMARKSRAIKEGGPILGAMARRVHKDGNFVGELDFYAWLREKRGGGGTFMTCQKMI